MLQMTLKTTVLVLAVFILCNLNKDVLGRPASKSTIRPNDHHPNEELYSKTRNSTPSQEIQFTPSQQLRDTPPNHVAFKAILGHDITNPFTGETVLFDQLELDTTNSYNPNIGVFTAPVSGVYYISLTVSSQSENGDHGVHLDLKKDGTSIGLTFLDNNKDWLKRNEVVILHLNAGDHLYVKIDFVLHPCTINGGTVNTHFQGFLIFPD